MNNAHIESSVRELWELDWQQTVVSEQTIVQKTTWLLFSETYELGIYLKQRLELLGHSVIFVLLGEYDGSRWHDKDQYYTLGFQREDPYKQLFEDVIWRGIYPYRVIYLCSLPLPKERGALLPQQLEEMVISGPQSILWLAKVMGLQQYAGPMLLTVITNNAFLLPQASDVLPTQSAIVDVSQAVSYHYPHIICRVIDLALPAVLKEEEVQWFGNMLCSEILAENFFSFVAYRQNTKWIPDIVPSVPSTVSPFYVRENGHYLLFCSDDEPSLALIESLIKHENAHFSLIIARYSNQWIESVEHTIQNLQGLGTVIQFLPSDTRQAHLQDMLKEIIQRTGGLNGVIALIQPHLLEQPQIADTIMHLQMNRNVLLAIDEVVKEHALDFQLVLSSLALHSDPKGNRTGTAFPFFLATPITARWQYIYDDSLWDNLAAKDLASYSASHKKVSLLCAHPETGAMIQTCIRRQLTLPVQEEIGVQELFKVFHSAPYLAPRNSLEEQLVSLWQKSLSIERIGVLDNFFDLGGDSILALRIISMAQQFDLHLTYKQISLYPTIAELAARLEKNKIVEVEAEQGLVVGPIPFFTGGQKWSLVGIVAYRYFPLLLEMRERANTTVLTQTITHLLSHHDILRLRVFHDTNGWHQYITDMSEPLPLIWCDLQKLTEEEKESVIAATVQKEYEEMHVFHGSLIRFLYFYQEEPLHDLLLIIIHHALIDEFSRPVFWVDLASIYQQIQQGQTVDLPPKTVSFKDYMEQLALYVNAIQDEEIAYWSTVPEFVLTNKNMSTQIENPGMPCGTTLWLGVEETTQLFSVLLQSHMTMNELLLAVITYAYVKWSGQPYLYITTNDPGRTLLEHVDVSRTIAFLNINKIFCLQAKEEAFLDVLASVQDQIQRMPTQGYGWELLNLYGDPSRVPPRILATRTANVNLVYFGVVSTNQVNADDDLWKPSYYYQDSVLPKADLTVADLQGQEENFLGIGCQSMVLHNRWKIALQYHKNIYQREDIEEFAEICMQAIQEFYRNYL